MTQGESTTETLQDTLADAPGQRRAALARVREQVQSQPQFWVFAYASLMWKPAFEPAEQRLARAWGRHRALQMHSRLDRGTAQRPGLVFALLPGGSCQGLVQRVPADAADTVLEDLWQREMDTGVYRPGWLNCQTAEGPVRALAFTLQRHSPGHTGVLSEAQLLDILRHANGRYGRTLDYLLHTARALDELGIRDSHVRRLLAMVHRHRLVGTVNTTPLGPGHRRQTPFASSA